MTGGTLWGLGLGPGDPDLITLKALRVLTRAPVIAYPAPDDGESFARSIAAPHIPAGRVEVPIIIPMRAARYPAQAVYDRAAEVLGEHLGAGRDVAVLCEGDPFFYGSFMYLFARMAGRVPVRIVPGVTSLTACAAAAALPLCARAEPLVALPGTLSDEALAARLGSGAAAILKVGRHLPRLRRLLTAKGLAARAVYVSHASLPHQIVAPLAEAPAVAPYFSMILIPGTDAHAAA